MSQPDLSTSRFFQEGADARAAGKPLADNPYCIRTDEHAEWAAGWRATFDLDEEDDPASDRDHDLDDETPQTVHPIRKPR